MKTAQEYIDGIRAMNPVVYAFGERVKNVVDHPCFEPTVRAVALTYEMAGKAEHENLFTVQSPLTGKKANRFLHVCQTPEDLVSRVQLGRFLTPRHGACVGARCPGTAAVTALHATTFEMDQKLGTDYHRRFLAFLGRIQEEDLACSGMITDAKGDRSKRPAEQSDPDAYLRIVEEREEGIVVRGAKAHQSGAAVAHENIVCPTTTMGPDEKAYAVAFAIPMNAPGIIHIAEAPAPNARRFVGDEMDFGNYRYGVHGSTLVVFENVFVPKERIFMCGEHEFTGPLVQRFAAMQRISSTACKVGHCDLVCGAAAVAAEYNGCEKMSHIREKIAELSFQATLAFGCAVASGHLASRTASGACMPNPLLVNAAKLQVVNAVWEASRIGTDVAGGIICTAPAKKDFENPDIAAYVEKYFRGRHDVPTEDRIRITRLLEYLVGQSSIVPTESTQGAGPPATQRLMIRLATHLDYYKRCARVMAGIEKPDTA